MSSSSRCLLERLEHVAREDVRARLRIVEREHGDVGFGERQRKRGGGRHAGQDTAELLAVAGLMTGRDVFAIRNDAGTDFAIDSCQHGKCTFNLFVVRLLVAVAAAAGIVLAAILLVRDGGIRDSTSDSRRTVDTTRRSTAPSRQNRFAHHRFWRRPATEFRRQSPGTKA